MDYEIEQDGQLDLLFIPPNRSGEQHYSHLMDLYDAIPKIHWGRVGRNRDEHGAMLPRQTLPALTRQFQHRKIFYRVTIIPARIISYQEDQTGVVSEWEYYPGQREEMVEAALRKMATDGQGALFRRKGDEPGTELVGVVFSIYALQKILASVKHTYSYDEIKESLLILRRTTITVFDETGHLMRDSNIFMDMGLNEKDKRGQAFVVFNPLITQSICARTFRQYNFKLAMSLKSGLSRWLYKRLCLNYTQASKFNPFNILLSTVIRDSGVTKYDKISHNIREFEKALEELKKCNVLSDWDEARTHDPARKVRILDVKYLLTPHADFCVEVKKFNFSNSALSPGPT